MMVWGEGYKKQFGKSCEACFSASKQGGPEHTLRPSFSMAKKSFRHAEAFFRASKSSEKWGSSSCRTPFRVSRTHPSAPLTKDSPSFDRLKDPRCRKDFSPRRGIFQSFKKF